MYITVLFQTYRPFTTFACINHINTATNNTPSKQLAAPYKNTTT